MFDTKHQDGPMALESFIARFGNVSSGLASTDGWHPEHS